MNEQPEYNNEEEAEVAQVLAITRSMAAVADLRNKLAEAALRPSLEECETCGEEIPEARRLAVKGVTKCIYCQQLAERRM